jgi:L-asparaginase
VLAPAKPLVLTAAMRPATALSADGPQNLLDAVSRGRRAGRRRRAGGAGRRGAWAPDLRKRHTTRPEAFRGGDAGPVAAVIEGRVHRWRDWPRGEPLGLDRLARDPAGWPWVAVLANHAGADGREVRALVDAGVQGLVVAGTGNGTLSATLEAALLAAARAGVPVRRCSRCGDGAVVDPQGSAIPSAGWRSPWQARVDLLLELLAQP